MALVILDRDGVINFDSDSYIRNASEWHPIPGSLGAIARLKAAGYTVAIASNQSGLARGLFTQADLDAIHAKLNVALGELNTRLDGVFFCPHGPDDGCDCRKPRPGLLQQISQQFGEPLDTAVMIGDSRRDLEAARAVGALAVLVRTGKDTTAIEQDPDFSDIPVYADLAEAAEALLAC